MERLTNRIKQLDKDDLIVYTKGKYEDTVPGEMSHDDIRAVLKKLAYYEDAEEEREQLDKALNELKRQEEQTMKQKLNRNDFKPGNTVEFADQKWNVLAQVSEDNFLCVNNGIIDHKEFDEDNNNNWSVSSLRKYLNGEYLQNFSGLELIPRTQDLTTDDGLKDYGSSTDLIFLLTDNQYRAYRQYMRRVDDWWWLITADSPINHYARYVLSDGTLSDGNAYLGYGGVRPACVIHLQSDEEIEEENE